MLQEAVLAIGWSELPDLSEVRDRDSLEEEYRRTYPDALPNRVANHVDQLHEFLHEAQDGELVLMPIKGQPAVAVGEITGPYIHKVDAGPGMIHSRPVRWLRDDIAREEFGPEFLNAFEAFVTFSRADVEEETVRKIVSEGAVAEMRPVRRERARDAHDRPPRGRGARELERECRHHILDALHRKFAGTRLANLVEEILKAQGFHTHRPDFMPEGGVDILAAPGPLNPGAPGLFVHVKSSDDAADMETYEALRDRMDSARAAQGVLLALGGFQDEVGDRARDSFFQVRLWDGSDLLDALLSIYERLPRSIQSQLPLRKVWALASGGSRRRGS
jgi:restriction system protein